MSIRYALFESEISGRTGVYTARVRSNGTVGQEELAERMVQRGCPLSQAEIQDVLDRYDSAVEEMLLEGKRVNTASANLRVSIRGLFVGPEDGYDTGRHHITVTASAGKRLCQAIRSQARVEKHDPISARPRPMVYNDAGSGGHNNTLTPGGLGQLLGYWLRFDPADAEQGVFFVAPDQSVARAEVVARNKPGELIFLVPPLAVGTYTLEVRARLRGHTGVCSGALDAPLTVA